MAGYTGGDEDGPTYRSLGGHTESVLVVFDPARVSYDHLLEVFWAAHDPYHNSAWSQYRNVVFATNPAQRAAVEQAVAALEQRSGQTVRTAVEDAGPFFAAEDYHQKYSVRRAGALYRALRRWYPGELEFLASTAVARINGYLGGNGSQAGLRRDLAGLGLSEEGRQELLEAAGGMLGSVNGER